MKTKPFDLIAALNGAPVVTRSGCKVKNVRFYSAYPIVAEVEYPDGTIYDETFTEKGLFLLEEAKFPLDLLMLDEEGGEE